MGTDTDRRTLTRRQMLRLSGGLAASLGLGAGYSPAVTAASAATGPAGRKGGKLRVAHTGDAPDLDPHVITWFKYPIMPQLYNTLIRFDPSRRVQPELAESWQYAPDRSYLDVKLRKGVKFHSGKELAAEDVVYTLERIQDPATASAQLAIILKGVKVEAVDPMTARFKLPGPTPALLDAFDRMCIIEKGAKKDDLMRSANGTGPFRLVEWRPHNVCRMTRNEAYWKPGKPVVDEIEVQVIADVSAMIVSLETGAIDVAERIPNHEHERLRRSNQVKLVVSQNPATTYDVLFNVTKPPFNDKRVRQAFSWAADRKRFVDRILFGVGKPKSIPWPDISLAYDAALDDYYQFNLDKAKALLAEAGFPNGMDAHMVISTQGWPELAKFAEMYQADLAKINVRLKLEDMDSARWNTTFNNSRFPQLITHAFGFAHKDPSLLFTAYPFQPLTGVSGYRSERYTNLVSQATAEPDTEKRKALYKQITELMVDEMWCMVLTPAFGSWGLRANVTGFAATLDDLELFENTAVG